MSTNQIPEVQIQKVRVGGEELFQIQFEPSPGVKTFLRGKTEQEVLQKLARSYSEAVQYSERLKKKLTTPQRQSQRSMSEIEKAELGRKIAAGDTSAVEAIVAAALREQAQAEVEAERQNTESRAFLQRHPEFQPCQGNANLMALYMRERGLAWDEFNLDLAYEAIKSQLALKLETTPASSAEPTPRQTKLVADVMASSTDEFEPILQHSKSMNADELRRKLRTDAAWASEFQEALDRKNARRQELINQRNAVVVQQIQKRLGGR